MIRRRKSSGCQLWYPRNKYRSSGGELQAFSIQSIVFCRAVMLPGVELKLSWKVDCRR